MRLHKFIAQASDLSRRAAEKAIASGEVRVNGRTVTMMGMQVVPGREKIHLRGRLLRVRKKTITLAFYKPKQTMVTKSDPQERKTIWDILPKKLSMLNAVGRLDYDTEGLLILTSDGDLQQRLTHPRHEVPKHYVVKVHGLPSDADLEALLQGMRDAGETLAAKSVKRLEQTTRNCWLSLTLHAGKYRQIRRMCEQLGYPVLKLKRVALGPIKLGTLRAGGRRTLAPREIRALWHAAGA